MQISFLIELNIKLNTNEEDIKMLACLFHKDFLEVNYDGAYFNKNTGLQPAALLKKPKCFSFQLLV